VERIAPAVGRAAKFFEKKLRDKKLARFALDRLIADPRGDGAGQADVIIEAIFENLEAKQALFADIEQRAKPARCWHPYFVAEAGRHRRQVQGSLAPGRHPLFNPVR